MHSLPLFVHVGHAVSCSESPCTGAFVLFNLKILVSTHRTASDGVCHTRSLTFFSHSATVFTRNARSFVCTSEILGPSLGVPLIRNSILATGTGSLREYTELSHETDWDLFVSTLGYVSTSGVGSIFFSSSSMLSTRSVCCSRSAFPKRRTPPSLLSGLEIADGMSALCD